MKFCILKCIPIITNFAHEKSARLGTVGTPEGKQAIRGALTRCGRNRRRRRRLFCRVLRTGVESVAGAFIISFYVRVSAKTYACGKAITAETSPMAMPCPYHLYETLSLSLSLFKAVSYTV